jgi:hypothetical protein
MRLLRQTVVGAVIAFFVGVAAAGAAGVLLFAPYIARNQTYVICQRALDNAKDIVSVLYELRSQSSSTGVPELEEVLDTDIIALSTYPDTGDKKRLDERFPQWVDYIRTYRRKYPSARTEATAQDAIQRFLAE